MNGWRDFHNTPAGHNWHYSQFTGQEIEAGRLREEKRPAPRLLGGGYWSPVFPQSREATGSPRTRSPLEDVEDTDGQVAEGKDQQHHHQHLGRLPPRPRLLHLSQEGPGPGRGLCAQALALLGRLVRGPLPVPHQGRRGARDLSGTRGEGSGGWRWAKGRHLIFTRKAKTLDSEHCA